MIKPTTLCIDIGNTRVKYLVYQGDDPQDFQITNDLSQEIVDRYISDFNVQTLCISSVRKNTPNQDFITNTNAKILILDHKTNIPITNDYETPSTLGDDRLAAVIGAHYLYPGENLIVIDMGTCITFDFIDKWGTYHGGNISPGPWMRLKAMNSYTKNLPLVEMKYHKDILGKNTEMALQNGVVRGTLYEIESFINSIKEKYGDLRTIFTGGDAKYFASYINNEIFVHQNLVLRGLNKIKEHNEH